MNIKSLLKNCYKNTFGIDLRKYHQSICRISDNETGLIDNLNRSKRIIFEDGISSNFKLELHKNLLFLIGDKTCYLCSNVIESAYGTELNWVKCIAIPERTKIKGETDIRKSGVIISLFSDLITEISNENQFFDFVNQFEYGYSECDWFSRIGSMSLYIRLAKFWDYKQKTKQLFELGLLYPLEFVIYILYKKVEIKNEQILKYFVVSLSESTNKILSFGELSKVFGLLNQSEIEDILAIKFLAENIHLNILDDDYFADLLEIDCGIRYPMFIDGKYNLYYMRDRANSIFKTQGVKKEYFKLIKQNFRALENRIRKGKGYEVVGSFVMEKLLYNKLSNAFSNLRIVSQYSPAWLQPQRIDIFIEDCNLAIEYHGAQHYMPIDFFGGKEGLRLRQELDRKKKNKCDENKIKLVEISYEEDFDFAFDTLKAIILEKLKDRI